MESEFDDSTQRAVTRLTTNLKEEVSNHAATVENSFLTHGRRGPRETAGHAEGHRRLRECCIKRVSQFLPGSRRWTIYSSD